MKKIVMATNNKGKIEELSKMLSGFDIISQREAGIEIDPEENGSTFLENATIKAEAIRDRVKDAYILAEDSGICIEALNGYPGVMTKRAAIEELGENITNEERNLYYINKLGNNTNRKVVWQTVICLIEPNGKKNEFIGEVEGIISISPMGDGGFGFDPIFYIEKEGKTLGQMTFEEKENYSARKRAVVKLIKYLNNKKIINTSK